MATHQSNDVETSVNFIKWLKLYEIEKPYEIFYEIPAHYPDLKRTNVELETKSVLIHDARGTEASFDLDRNGFMFSRQSSEFGNFFSREAVETLYFPQVEEIMKANVKGADKVTIFDWRVRSSKPLEVGTKIELNEPTDRLSPVLHAHIDQSAAGALQRIKKHHPEDYHALIHGRVRIINLWRPIHTVQSWPLAVCDGSTLREEDLVEVDHVRRSYVGSNLSLLHRPYHSWHYLSHQATDELLLFKVFDSESTVAAACCPHVSFPLPSTNTETPPRESIEFRALVFTLK